MGRSAPGTGTKTRKVNGIEEISVDPDLCRAAVVEPFAATEASGDGEESDDYAIALLDVVPIVTKRTNTTNAATTRPTA